MEYPIYQIFLKEGITAISLVEDAAIQYDFLLFSGDNQVLNFEVVSNELREVFGVIMLADTPIFRNNKFGPHFVVLSPEVIREMVTKYFKEKLTDSVTLGHKLYTDDSFLMESFIIDRKNGINPPVYFNEIPDGSWVGRFKVTSDELWNEIKEGKYKGFSIETEMYYDFDPIGYKEMFNKNKDLKTELLEIYKLMSI